ncbi:F-box domain containing protein, partial [Tanacetum coccineum]
MSLGKVAGDSRYHKGRSGREAIKDDQYILVTQAKQVFYLEDKTKPHWKVLRTNLNDLDTATLHIDGQSTVVDAPPDIIDVPDEDDDIIDDEDALPHDLADSDVEDLINVDDDGAEKVYSSKGKRKPNLGGRGAGRLNTRDKTRNLSLKDIAEAKGPVSINFDVRDKQTLNPLGPHVAHWSNYIGEVVRSVPLPCLTSGRTWNPPAGQRSTKASTCTCKKPTIPTRLLSRPSIGRQTPPPGVTMWRRSGGHVPRRLQRLSGINTLVIGDDPKNLARAAQNRLNRQKSVVTSRQGSRSLARLRDEMRQASDTQEYPSLIDTFWRTHTVDGVFPKDEDRRIYEMKRLEATGEYTEDEINAWQEGVDFMMSLFRSDSKYSDMFKEFESGGASGSGGCGDDEESGDDEDGEDEDDDGESCGESIQVLVQGKVALVTGGDSGIGRSVCYHFAIEGATVAFTYVKGDEDIDAMETLKIIHDSKVSDSGDPIAIPTDLKYNKNCEKVVEEVVAKYGRIDILVNNAAIQYESSLEEITEERLERVFRTNIFSHVFMS